MAPSKSAKMESLLKILRLLSSSSTQTPAQLAEALEVTERTVYRYMTELQGAGYPIYFDRQKTTYRFIDGYKLTDHSDNNELFQAITLKSRMTESLSVGMVSYDDTGRCITANNAAGRLLTTGREYLIDQNYYDLESWHSSGLIVMAREVMSSGIEARGEFHFITSFGRELWIYCNMSRLTHKGKHHLVLVFQDISTLKSTEIELRRTQELMRQFLEHTPVCTYIKDELSRPVLLSRNFEQLFGGMPLDQIIGKEMTELLPPDIARRVIEEDRKVLESDKVFQEDDVINGKHYSTTKFSIHIESGSYTGGFILDVNERKLNEIRARELADQFQILAGAISDAVLVVDTTGKVLFANDQACTLYGQTKEEILSKQVTDFELDTPPEEAQKRKAIIMSEGKHHYRTNLKRMGGAPFEVEVNANRLAGSEKYLAVIREI